MIGMILALDHSKFMTEGDVLEILNVGQADYNIFITIFLALLAIGIAIFGFIIPRMINKNIKDSEDRIKEDSLSNENRLNKELVRYRAEARQFQRGIDNRIEERINRRVEDFDRLIEEKTRELSAEIMKQKEYLKKLIKITEIHNTGSLYISHNKYSLAISELLKAIELSIREDIYEDFDEMVSNIKFFNEIKAEIDILKVENELGKEINTYINSLVELAKDDTRKKEYLNKILKDINEIFKIEDDK